MATIPISTGTDDSKRRAMKRPKGKSGYFKELAKAGLATHKKNGALKCPVLLFWTSGTY